MKIEAAVRLQATTFGEYIKSLKSKGIKVLGKGTNAVVLQHPTMPDVAVRVFHDDPGFEQYLKWCKANPTNKYGLTIFDTKEDTITFGPKKRPRKVQFVFTEKLKPTPDARNKEFARYAESLVGRKPQEDYFIGDYQDDFEFWDNLAKQSKDKDLAKFAKWYCSLLEGFDTPDLHEDNIMLRGNQIVFIDPFG